MHLPLFQNDQTSLAPLEGKTIAMIGYGNQGRPQAQNLKDSGLSVVVGLREESPRREQALADGFKVTTIEAAVEQAQVVMLILPDAAIGSVYQERVKPHLKSGQYLGFCHGLALLAGWIQPDPSINVFLMAPKAQGKGVRSHYLDGTGVVGLVAVHQDPSGNTLDVALAYGRGLGCHHAGILKVTVQEETVTNLFAEQTVLCGGLSELAKTAFEVLVESGYPPEVAYFECLHEIRLLANLLHDEGITGMRRRISPTACFGDVTRGDKVIDGHVKESMRQILNQIHDKTFMKQLKEEAEAGNPITRYRIEEDEAHLIEQTGKELRAVGLI